MSNPRLRNRLFQRNICMWGGSAGFSGMMLPSITATAPRVAAPTKSLLICYIITDKSQKSLEVSARICITFLYAIQMCKKMVVSPWISSSPCASAPERSAWRVPCRPAAPHSSPDSTVSAPQLASLLSLWCTLKHQCLYGCSTYSAAVFTVWAYNLPSWVFFLAYRADFLGSHTIQGVVSRWGNPSKHLERCCSPLKKVL